ncbi:hypothetical protein GQ54DRAFT_300854 [Martensiomyces pterosporus]|nr:hypothetical protein GQ54DRAFT_300854 [Martensiomyces pterosporus]
MEHTLSGTDSTPPRAPLAPGFSKWTSARTEGFPKMPVEKHLYSAFRDLVLFVMRCLKGIVPDPPEAQVCRHICRCRGEEGGEGFIRR